MNTPRWRRRIAVGAALAVLVLLAAAAAVKGYGAFRLRGAERRFSAEVGPIDLASHAVPSTEEGRRSARKLAGAAQAIALPEGKEKDAFLRLQDEPISQWTPEDRARLGKVLADNASALSLLRELPAGPEAMLAIPYREGARAKLPNLLDGINAAKLLRLDAMDALSSADLERAITDVETLGAIARAYERESALIVVLVGTAVERFQLLAIRDALSDPALRPEHVERLRGSLPAEDLDAALKRAFGFEVASTARSFRRGDHEYQESLGVAPPRAWRVLSNVAEDLFLARLLVRYTDLAACMTGGAAAYRELHARGMGWPNIESSVPRLGLTGTLRRLASAALDVRSAALGDGRYPDTLPDAHRGADPFTGAEIRYARADDGSATLEFPGAEGLVDEFQVIGTRPSFHWTLPGTE